MKRINGFTPLHPESKHLHVEGERVIKFKLLRKSCSLGKGVTGFTLVEIMFSLAIVALIAAIAIPNLLRARINSNESAAQATLRVLATAATGFAAVNGGSYPANFSTLVNSVPPYIDTSLDDGGGAPQKQGYFFTYSPIVQGANNIQFWIQAYPVTLNVTGNNFYYTDELGAICRGLALAGGHANVGSACPAGYNPAN